MSSILSIVLLGTGNVAQQLFDVLHPLPDATIAQVYGRNTQGLNYFRERCAVCTNADAIQSADLYIIVVSDTAIPEVSQLLQKKKGLVAHTSGSVPMEALNAGRKAVFYPLQTFTKGRTVNFKEIPICLEVERNEDAALMEGLAQKLSEKVVWITSAQRKKLHMSAVIVNNFANHCYQMASEICEAEQLPFELLHPLIQETASKVLQVSPKEAQTGPARRNDVLTQQEHLELLKNPLHKKIYQLLSESITQQYEKKL